MQTVGAEAVICRSCFRALSQVEAAAACGGFSAGRGPVAVGRGVWEWSRGVGLPYSLGQTPGSIFVPSGPLSQWGSGRCCLLGRAWNLGWATGAQQV